MTSTIVPLLFAFLGFTATPGKAQSSWSLSVECPQDEVVADGPLLVRVTLENSDSSPQVAFKGFWPSGDDNDPRTVLRFEVVRDGEPIGFLGRMPPGHYGWKPHWSQFEEIPAGWFFGTTVNLQADPWRFQALKAGTYRIRARVEFHARTWFEKQQKVNPEEETVRRLYPQRELLASGEVVSNEIVIRVRAGSGH